MRLLLQRTARLLFGAGGTMGGTKRVKAPKMEYDKWLLTAPARRLLAPLHHPLVTEYLLRLDCKRERIERAQADAAEHDGKALANVVDGSPFDAVRWNATYRDEVDTAHALAQLLRQVEQSVELRDQLRSAGAESDAELLAMVEDELTTLLDAVRGLDPAITHIMRRRLSADHVIAAASKRWNVNVAGKAGGEEAGLFAAELADMLKTYAREHRQLQVRDLAGGDELVSAMGDGEEGASSSSQRGDGYSFQLTGEDVYRNFRHEIGVHKVQRVPVTDAAGKMQTSTAVCTMMPVLDPVSVNVLESDCKIDYVRGSGPGGQGMQSSSNCVVLTHRPSGISVKCHQSRSALGNKERALQMVAQQLLQRRVKEQNSTLDSAWRNQWTSGERAEKMRTYNFPQNRVTDHRLGKDYPLRSFMERGSGLCLVHDELNEISDLETMHTVLLRHIAGDFGSTV